METLFSCPKAKAVREHMAHTTGTFEWHKHWLGLIYTDGILFVAETCGAHWLIDLVASHQPAIKRKHREHWDFQVWRLARTKAGTWIADCWADTPDESHLLARQVIGDSDFPEELSPFEFWVEGGTMLLKQEH